MRPVPSGKSLCCPIHHDPKKNWKFAAGDLAERKLWDQYMAAYQSAITETSKPWAPWYVIPADDKPYMRATVADIVVKSIESLDLEWPELSKKDQELVPSWRKALEAD